MTMLVLIKDLIWKVRVDNKCKELSRQQGQ